MSMNRETILNIVLAALLIAVPVIAQIMGEPFIITLATKVAILGMAGVGLNIALGYGGLVSFGHAAFFGIGGYAAGILASHALNYEPIMTAPFEINGTTQMIVIWIVALIASALVALLIGAITLRTSGVYFIMITLAFAQMIYYFAISWPAYGGEDGLSIYVRNSFPGLNTLDPISFFALCADAGCCDCVFSGADPVAVWFGPAWGAAKQPAHDGDWHCTVSRAAGGVCDFGDDYSMGRCALCRP